MMKKKYEKPVAEVIRIYDNMQMICASPDSGFNNKTSIEIDKWKETEETDADGTSTEIKEFPDWLH